MTFDATTGAIVGLLDKTSGVNWASTSSPLFAFNYRTYDAADVAGFIATYVLTSQSWAAVSTDAGGADVDA